MTDALLPRVDYPTLDDCTYLNQASLGLMGQPAVSAMTRFIEQIGRHGNSHMSDSDEVAFFENLRTAGARILNAAPANVAIVASASEILGQLPFLIRPEPGTKVLAVRTDFPALTRPWLRLASEGEHSLHFVDDDPALDLTDALIDALDEQTSVLAASHVQYATGTAIDVPRLRAATERLGVSLIVDVTQAAGAMTMDANQWGADAVVSSGYKWLGGHGGAALAVLSPALLAQTPPLPGWMGASDPFDFDATQLLLADNARRFTQSTMSYASMVSLTVGIEQLMAAGIHNIKRHAEGLVVELMSSVVDRGWQPFRVLENPGASPHIISLGHDAFSESGNIQVAVEKLRERNVVCSFRGGRIRVSLAPYNNSQDIQNLINTLGEMKV